MEEEERNNVCDLTVRNGESERAGEEERRKPFTAIKCPRMMGGRKKVQWIHAAVVLPEMLLEGRFRLQ